ncbi:hypothetical protein [Micromonospora avicenniae]|uniref:Uncharacterized protein n=1 Tax=Micromonospora avicenniae TaxID=1198245 RepID=A0A1N7D8S0_9ACTN|nr:hypothetical protein [Micromonospora avicenniae]SIR72125.1 hypothetical protein SAMN05444858_115120 [Micromonospora avicenniae]
MTDAPDPAKPPRADRWRQATQRAYDRSRRTGLRAGKWLARRWRQTVAMLQDTEPTTAPAALPAAPTREVLRRDAQITVPAQGYIYAFVIRASFTWSAEGLRPELLSWHAQRLQPLAVQRLTRLAAELARTTASHQAGKLEVDLQQAIGEANWTWRHAGGTVTGRPDAWVRLDERVQQALLPYSQRRVTLISEYELHLARARSAQLLARRWAKILGEYADTAAVAGSSETQERLIDAARRMIGLQKIAAQWIEDLLAERPRTDNWFDRPQPPAPDPPPEPRRPHDVPRQSAPPPTTKPRDAAADGDSPTPK